MTDGKTKPHSPGMPAKSPTTRRGRRVFKGVITFFALEFKIFWHKNSSLLIPFIKHFEEKRNFWVKSTERHLKSSTFSNFHILCGILYFLYFSIKNFLKQKFSIFIFSLQFLKNISKTNLKLNQSSYAFT